MQQPLNFEIKDKNHGLLVSPRFQIASLLRLLEIEQAEIHELNQKYKTKFSSLQVLLDSRKLPFLTSVVIDFLHTQVITGGSEYQKLIVLVNKAVEVKMQEQDKEAFKKLMMQLRQQLIKNKHTSAKSKLKLLDQKLCTPKFQKLIFQKFYFMYLWRVAREERKVLEKSQDNLKKCFTIVAQVFKANIKILHYSKERGFKKTAEFTFPASQGVKGASIYLLYHKQVFLQLNPEVVQQYDISYPSKSDIIKQNSTSLKKWIEFSAKAHVNEQIEKGAIIDKVMQQAPSRDKSSSDSDNEELHNHKNIQEDEDSDSDDQLNHARRKKQDKKKPSSDSDEDDYQKQNK